MSKLRYTSWLFLVLAACARQGAIPNTDKFPPHLVSVTSVNRTQTTLIFDEDPDLQTLLPNTFILASAGDTADIHFIAKDPMDSRRPSIILLTSPLKDDIYTISGLVADPQGNAASIRANFRASTRVDTTPPTMLISYPANPRTTFPYSIILSFSEPVDTTQPMRILTAPSLPKEALTLNWSPNLARYDAKVDDTTFKTKPFYFLLLPGVSDFAGNRTKEGRTVFVYSDTSLVFHDVWGKVNSEAGTPAFSAIVLFKTPDNLFAATIADAEGTFIVTLEEKEKVTVEAYFDRDGNGVYEEETRLLQETLQDSITLQTRSAASPRSFYQLVPQNP